MKNKISVNILDEAARLFTAARVNLIAGTELLWKIREEKMWEGSFSSFSEYLNSECQISDGQASKLLKSYEYFVITHGFGQDKIAGVDFEKLYLSTSLPFEPEGQLLRAKEWTRQEIRDQLSSGPEGDCKHDCPHVEICSRCSRRV